MNIYSGMKVGVIGGHNGCGMHIANLLQTKPLEKIIIVGESKEKKTDLAELLKERNKYVLTNLSKVLEQNQLSQYDYPDGKQLRRERRQKQRK